jgi:hypothetical protein
MTDPVFSAVCKLVDAVLIEHCIAVDQHLWHEEHTVDCVLAVLREIRAAEELTSLHNWADTRLSAHGDDAYKLDGTEFLGPRDVR